MASEIVERHSYHKTNHRGFVYRLMADGTKQWWGYVPGRGRVRLEATGQRDALAEWNELRGKRDTPINRRNVTLRDLEPEWWTLAKAKLATSTRTEYRAALDLVHLPLFGHKRLTDIDANMIAKLDHGLAERGLNYIDTARPVRPLSRSQRDNYLKPLRKLFAYAVRHRLGITSNPFDVLTEDDRAADDRETYVHEWTDDEIDTALRIADERDRRAEARQHYATLIRFGFETGGRLGEILGAQWQDLELDGDAPVWHVRRQWTKHGELTSPKTKAGVRRVPLTPEFARELKRLKLASPFSQESDPVFASQTGGYLGHRNVQRRAWEPVAEQAGLALSFHQIRHGFASRAAHRGVKSNKLSVFMGHSDTGVTERVYVHLFDREQAEDDFREAMAR